MQYDQYGMMENTTGGGCTFNSNAFPQDLGTLNYIQGDNMGFSGGGGGTGGGGGGNSSTYDPRMLNRQNLSNCSCHSPIPNIIFTGNKSWRDINPVWTPSLI